MRFAAFSRPLGALPCLAPSRTLFQAPRAFLTHPFILRRDHGRE